MSRTVDCGLCAAQGWVEEQHSLVAGGFNFEDQRETIFAEGRTAICPACDGAGTQHESTLSFMIFALIVFVIASMALIGALVVFPLGMLVARHFH